MTEGGQAGGASGCANGGGELGKGDDGGGGGDGNGGGMCVFPRVGPAVKAVNELPPLFTHNSSGLPKLLPTNRAMGLEAAETAAVERAALEWAAEGDVSANKEVRGLPMLVHLAPARPEQPRLTAGTRPEQRAACAGRRAQGAGRRVQGAGRRAQGAGRRAPWARRRCRGPRRPQGLLG